MKYYVYITTNFNRTVLYTGFTSNLYKRIREHYFNKGNPSSFSTKYYTYNLIHYEEYSDKYTALMREKEIKLYTREKKELLIKEFNSDMIFLNNVLFGDDWFKHPILNEYIKESFDDSDDFVDDKK